MRVLVAEDDPALRSVLERGLRNAGYAVDAVADGTAALDFLAVYDYEVAVLDWRMPRTTGIEVLQALRRRGSRLPVLLLTARDTSGDRVTGLDEGADDYLVKPFDFPELLARLRALQRRGHSAVSSLVAGDLVFDPARRELSIDGRPGPADPHRARHHRGSAQAGALGRHEGGDSPPGVGERGGRRRLEHDRRPHGADPLKARPVLGPSGNCAQRRLPHRRPQAGPLTVVAGGTPAADRAEERRRRASSVRVALIATLVFLVVYGGVVVVLDVLVTKHLLAEVDRQLSTRLSESARRATTGGGHYGLGIYGEPIEIWTLNRAGRVVSSTRGAPPLSPEAWSRSGAPTSHTLSSVTFRLLPRHGGSGWRIAGESLTELDHVEDVLAVAEALALPVLLVAVFLAALAIGLRSAAPVEQARRRQLEFTADASHELRTPLSVIDAEIGLELARLEAADPADAGDPGRRSYRAALSRLAAESLRLRRIVEDLLWLARFDAAPLPAGAEPIDLATLASACVERFGPVAAGRSLQLSVVAPGEAVTILAPAEWIDRLAGVLVDNACRYAGEGGSVRVVVSSTGSRASLAVEDSGPGIPLADQRALFDRFRRGTDEPGGHGLGLAIADGIVRATRGRWRIGTAAAGGARMEVSWPSA